MKHGALHKITRDLLLAEKNYDRKLDAFLREKTPTRRRETTLVAQRMIAAEWLGKCEDEFEKYINDRIMNGKFHLTNTPELKNKEENNGK